MAGSRDFYRLNKWRRYYSSKHLARSFIESPPRLVAGSLTPKAFQGDRGEVREDGGAGAFLLRPERMPGFICENVCEKDCRNQKESG